jgi:hypothetical protein
VISFEHHPTPLGTAALKQTPAPELNMLHAIMLVTREWCMEAETAEEARELLAAGHGHRFTWAIAYTSSASRRRSIVGLSFRIYRDQSQKPLTG